MDNMIIGGVRIYFPRPGEKLPTPFHDMQTFAIKGTTGVHCCLLDFWEGEWRVFSLTEYESSDNAIMAAVRPGKHNWLPINSVLY